MRAMGAGASQFISAPRLTRTRCARSSATAAGAEAAEALVFERSAARDWVRESLRGLKPVAAGRFLVHGAHDRARVPAERRRHRDRGGARVRHRPSRHHPRLPARARPALQIDEQAHAHAPASRRQRSAGILDLGTGSGVLAVAAARALRRRVLATDIDPTAVRAARANARLNRAGTMIEVVKAEGVSAGKIRRRAPFRSCLRQHPARAAAAHRRSTAKADRARRPHRAVRPAAGAGERGAGRLSRLPARSGASTSTAGPRWCWCAARAARRAVARCRPRS